ncbi:MAG: hypothetical protein ACPG4Y_09740 [Chitinophagales bacterium]
MDLQTILLKLIIGGSFGMIGQGLRMIIGLKKLNQVAASNNIKFGEVFESSRFLISLFIGFSAGVLAIFFMDQFDELSSNNNEQLAALIAIGYSGTDFLEGFMSKHLPSNKQVAKLEPSPVVINNNSSNNTDTSAVG